MPYIFHTNRYFSLINATPKNGVFCQSFSPSSSKPIPISSQYTTDYSAHMDTNGKLYVAVMPDAFHLNYYIYEGNRFARNSLISNANSNFILTSPIIYTLQNTPYIVYLSHQAESTSYNFVQENLYNPQLITLLTCHTQPSLIKSYITPYQLFVFFITHDEGYHLNVLQISETQVTSSVYLNSPQPISDYSVCIEEDTLHITYISELHGKYQLSYFNNYSNQITTLVTTQYPCYPVIFCYYNIIWINALINHKLQMIISIDNGKTFSLPAPCSIQNNIHRCYFLTHTTSPFIGQEIYASITSYLKLCTLSMIDFPRFHTDTVISSELELLLEGLLLTIESASSSTQTLVSKTEPPISQPTKPNSSESTTSGHTISDAKSAFMNELTGWDLPPRL